MTGLARAIWKETSRARRRGRIFVREGMVVNGWQDKLVLYCIVLCEERLKSGELLWLFGFERREARKEFM